MALKNITSKIRKENKSSEQDYLGEISNHSRLTAEDVGDLEKISKKHYGVSKNILKALKGQRESIFSAFNPKRYLEPLSIKLNRSFLSISQSFDNFKQTFSKNFLSPKGILGGMIFGVKSILTSTLSGLFGKRAAERRHRELLQAINQGNFPNKEISFNTSEMLKYFMTDYVGEGGSRKLIKKTFKEQKRTRVGIARVNKRIRDLIKFFTGKNLRNLLTESLEELGENLKDSFDRLKTSFVNGFNSFKGTVGTALKFVNPKFYIDGIKSAVGKLGGMITGGLKKVTGGIAGFFGGIAGWFGGKKRINREFLQAQLKPIIDNLLFIKEGIDQLNYQIREDIEDRRSSQSSSLSQREIFREEELEEERRHEEEMSLNEQILDAIRSDYKDSKKESGVLNFLKGTLAPFIGIAGKALAGIAAALGMKGVAEGLLNRIPKKAPGPAPKKGFLGKAGKGGAGLALGFLSKSMIEDTFAKSMQGEDIGAMDFLKNAGSAAASGALMGSFFGVPGALIGGGIGALVGLGSTTIAALTPSQQEAEEKSRQKLEEQRNKEAIARLKEKEGFDYNRFGKSKVSDEQLKKMSVRDLTALLAFDDFNEEDLNRIKAALEERTREQEEIAAIQKRRSERKAKQNEEKPRRQKLEELLKQKKETLAAQKAMGASAEELAKLEEQFNLAIKEVEPNFFERVMDTTIDGAKIAKDKATNVIGSGIDTVKELSTNLIDKTTKAVNEMNLSENLKSVTEGAKKAVSKASESVANVLPESGSTIDKLKDAGSAILAKTKTVGGKSLDSIIPSASAADLQEATRKKPSGKFSDILEFGKHYLKNPENLVKEVSSIAKGMGYEDSIPRAAISQFIKEKYPEIYEYTSFSERDPIVEALSTKAQNWLSKNKSSDIDVTIKTMQDASAKPQDVKSHKKEKDKQQKESSLESIKAMSNVVASGGASSKKTTGKFETLQDLEQYYLQNKGAESDKLFTVTPTEYTDRDKYDAALEKRTQELFEARLAKREGDVSPRTRENLKKGARVQAENEIKYTNPYFLNENKVNVKQNDAVSQLSRGETDSPKVGIIQGSVNKMADTARSGIEMATNIGSTISENISSNISNITVNAPSTTLNNARGNTYQNVKPSVGMNF